MDEGKNNNGNKKAMSTTVYIGSLQPRLRISFTATTIREIGMIIGLNNKI